MRYKQKIETVIDKSTGEIYSEKSIVFNSSNSILYTKLYPDKINIAYNVYKVNLECFIANYITINAEFKTNKIYLLKETKEEIARITGKSIKSINNAISVLNKKEYIVRIRQGVYILNPLVAFKGNEKDRIEVMKLLKPNNLTNFENETN